MLQIAVSGFIAVAAVIGAYSGYGYYAAMGPPSAPAEAAKADELVRTDYITIEIFKGGSVAGYLSFRADAHLRDPAAIDMVGYHISDFAHRNLSKLTQLVPLPVNEGAAKALQSFLLPALKVRMGAANISALEVVDVAFDKRIQPAEDAK